jgi:hypothetical protein
MSATGIEIPIVSTYKDKGAKAASKSLNTLTKSAKALGLAFGVFQTINFSKKAVRAFADDERAAGALSKTLQNLGQSYAVLQTAGFIQNLQNTTGILDDQLRPAFTQLVNSTLDAKEAQKLLSVALDVSAGTGKDLQSVTVALSKAVLKENTALSRLGIGLSKAELATMDMAQITDFLSKKFDGQAALAADSYAGKLAVLSAKASDAAETIGGSLVVALDKAFGDPEKIGSGIDVIANKISGLIEGMSRFIQVTKIGLQNLTLSPDSPIFQYKLNFDKPFDPMSQKFDYTALQKEEKRLQNDAKKNLAARNAAIKKEQALLKDQAKLKKFGSMFDTEQIEIFAALQGKITEQEKLRLSLQLALIQGNATEAEKLGKQLAIAQLQTTDLAAAIAKIPKALNPFEGFGSEVDNLIAKILNMYKLLQQPLTATTTTPITTTSSGSTNPTLAAIASQIDSARTKLNNFNERMLEKIANTNKIPETTIEQDIQSQLQSYLAADTAMRSTFKDLNINIAPAGSVVTTGDLVQDIRNALIEAGLSGSQTTINRNLGAFQVQ